MRKTFREFTPLLSITLLIMVMAVLLAPVAALGQYGYGFSMPRPAPRLEEPGFASNLGNLVISALVGALIGAFCSQKFKEHRKYFWWGVLAISVIVALFNSSVLSSIIGFWVGFIAAYVLLRDHLQRSARDTTHGSAEWATGPYLKENGVTGEGGLYLGYFDDNGQPVQLQYTGNRHLLTVSPTGGGKGACAIVPNLLTYNGSVLCIDPKGENALMTAGRRGAGDPARKTPGIGQKVHIVDPWAITGLPGARFNPLGWLDPEDPDISENAMILADSIVVNRRGNAEESFWDDEAKAVLMGLNLFVALDAAETDKTLGRIRDIIAADAEEFDAILTRMIQHANRIVRSTAARLANMEPKLRSNVMVSLQSHTHFLESPRIRESLSRSDFRFEDLKTSKMTVYLVLPADRLEPFGRWLRLLIQQAITVNARNITEKPEKPILFMLDEMAALGHLKMVEQAYGLMAGFGMQLWGIVQDISQIERIYGKGWETFVSNSGVLQYFGSRDEKTAGYFSKLCGVTTIRKFSFSRALSRAFTSGGNSNSGGSTSTTSETYSYDVVQRQLAFADELMVMRRNAALVLVENLNPIHGRKLEWFKDEKFRQLGVDLRQKRLDQQFQNLFPEGMLRAS